MNSIYQKVPGNQRELGTGAVKVYQSGIVGYQPSGQSHSDYEKAMRPLKNVTPQNADALLSRYFGKK